MILQLVISLYFLPFALAQYTPAPRWAQAVALLDNTLFVHGGLSDPFNSYTYTSAPQISDLLVLDLSKSFDSTSPPWQLSSTNASPALAWHTLSAFSLTELLLFGGQPGPNSLSVLTTLNDSAGLLMTSGNSGPSFLTEPQSWANEPMRRIRHSSSYASGMVWIIGGEKADGSGNAFSEHYAFNPSGPEFIWLPSSSIAPPDIYGHVSLVLPDGRLLVLGGYCASCSQLVPMNTVWSLNTTTKPLVWEKLSISNMTLPSPRRDFAAVVLITGQVLIHGGGDADLQTTFSDGWILDTSQNPMVWNNIAALTQLGQRKNHFAVQSGDCVLFCFGYGSSSPASASLSIYDPTTSSMLPSYTAPPPDSTPAIVSLPAPTPTCSDPTPNGGTSTISPGGTSGVPSSSSGSSTGSGSHTTAIILGTIFGVIGLIAIGFAAICYMKRGRNRDRRASGRFLPLENAPELSDEGSVGNAAAEAAHLDGRTIERGVVVDRPGVITDILAHLGINKISSRPHQPRKDMFADEDTRSFGWVGHSNSVYRQGSEGTSVWSLRSVGALVLGVIGREPSGSGTDQGDHQWEKIDHLREGCEEGLIRKGSLHNTASSHPTHRRDGSLLYTDPFEDPLPADDYDDLNLRQSIPVKDADYDSWVPISTGTDISELPVLGTRDSVWSFSEHSRMLAPLREVSNASLTDPSNPLSSVRESPHLEITTDHANNATLTPPPDTSPMSYSPTLSRFSDPHPATLAPRYSTISSSTLSHSPSMSRHDNWWTRITKSPFLDRRLSISSTKPLDFRDPTPAPPLVALEEPKQSSDVPAHSDDTLVDPVRHDKSLSSTHSGRTANTDRAEHLCGTYDVVQRLASDGSSSRRAPSLGSAEIAEPGKVLASAVDNLLPTESASSSSSAPVDPPRSTLPLAPPIDLETPPESLMSQTPPNQRIDVTDRVKAYERRLSHELELQKLPSPRNTRRREEVPSRSRPTIQYGVAPRASLFIANPDLGHVS